MAMVFAPPNLKPMAKSPAPTSRPRGIASPVWPWAGLLGALVFAVYAPTLRAPLLFDDIAAVTLNPTIRQLGSWQILQPPADGSTTSGRPLVNVTLAFNYALGGEDPLGFHLFNLSLHVASALLLFGLVRRTLQRLSGESRLGGVETPWAAAVALLWAVHPLQTESVISVAQRTELLGGGFILVTLYAFVRASTRAPAAQVWLGVAVGAAALGVLAKETVVTAPVLVWLYDRAFVAGSGGAAWRARRGFYLALLATWAPLGALLIFGGGTRGVAAGLGLGVTSWEYLLTQAGAVVRYLALTVWPYPLVLDYGASVVRAWQDALLPGFMVLTLLGGAGWLLVRRPRAGFLAAWAFVLLAPSSSFVPLVTQTIAEHRMYLPLAGPIVAFGLWASGWGGRRTTALLFGVAAVMAVVTARRAALYRDPVKIWSDTVVHAPGNPRAWHNLGLALQQAGQVAAAEEQFARAIALDPRHVSARYAWGLALLQRDNAAAAVDQLEAAVALEPRHADAWLALGNARMRLEQFAAAVAAYDASLRLVAAPDVRHNLAVALMAAGRAAERAADPVAAERDYRRAVDQEPAAVEPRRRLGLLLARTGNVRAAEDCLREALRLAPADLDTTANLANVLVLQGRVREAIPLYEEVLARRPGDVRTQENLAAARASLR